MHQKKQTESDANTFWRCVGPAETSIVVVKVICIHVHYTDARVIATLGFLYLVYYLQLFQLLVASIPYLVQSRTRRSIKVRCHLNTFITTITRFSSLLNCLSFRLSVCQAIH